MKDLRRRYFLSLRGKEAIQGFLFISPALAGLILFHAGPILATLFLSGTRYSILSPPSWVGLANYAAAFRDELFPLSLWNTTYYVVISVPLGIALAFAVAVLLNRIKGATFYRTAYYVPAVVPSVAAAVIWLVMLNPNIGLVNRFLDVAGIDGPGWLIDPAWSKPGLIVMGLWGIGTGMVLYLAGLQSIPEHLYDAAKIDGAGSWKQFRYVTLPMMTPTLFFHLVIGLIASFQIFNSAFIMTRGGPVNSTYFYALYIYDNAFSYFKMGFAAALAWILFVIVLLFTLVVLRTSRSWVYYEGSTGGGF